MNEIEIRCRTILINNEQMLLMHNKAEDYYFFAGGHLEYGETIDQGAKREIREELGEDVIFNFDRIGYIRELIDDEIHSLEFFLFGSINRWDELAGNFNPEQQDNQEIKLIELDRILQLNVKPLELTKLILTDYAKGQKTEGKYVGNI